MDDTEWADRARRGEADAFEELVRRTSRMVFARCVLEMGDPQRAEDLTQETFFAAWRAIRTLKESGGFRGWLLRIAQNACIDARRREARLRRTPPGSSSPEILEGVAARRDSGALPPARRPPKSLRASPSRRPRRTPASRASAPSRSCAPSPRNTACP